MGSDYLKKRVFISGITGTMGGAALRHLLGHEDKLDLVSLVRPSKKNKELMKAYDSSSIEIIWGDLTQYEDVKRAIRDADYIFHLAAFVSPEADLYPKRAWEINLGSVENILRAVEELKLQEVKLVYIGSVAQTGSRLPPIHWGRVGDPLKPSVFDNYATSKIAAERLVIESGLDYWVSLRQTGILHYGLLEMMDPIIFHQPWNNVLEWISEEDSGRLMANLATKNLPEEFWKRVYNIGGESTRLNNYQFTSKILGVLGVKDIEKVFQSNWFAKKNFHGQYYLDSDILNDYLDFRRESFDDFVQRLKDQLAFPSTILKYMPDFFIKNFIMKGLARGKGGSMEWIREKDQEKIHAFFGSEKEWEEIPSWRDFSLDDDYDRVKILDHGYDENKDIHLLDIEDMKGAASFRGGQCLSPSMERGDMDSKLKWRCAFSHEFHASPRLVLFTGHWCEECEAPPWRHEEIGKKNPFFAQVLEED